MRYEALGPGVDGAPSKTSSALVILLVTRSVCMYMFGVDGFRVYGRLRNFISASRRVWGSEGLGGLMVNC